LGARLSLPAFITADGGPRYPAGYKDYLTYHERAPGIGPLAGWRGEHGDAHGKGAPNPNQLQRYIDNGCFWKYELPEEQHYYKHANRAYLDNAVALGLIGNADPIVLQLYVEPLQRFRLAAQGHGAVTPPERLRARIATHFDPLPIWYPPFEGARVDTEAFPLNAITQRPMPMYHSWGGQNAWLRQIHGANRLFINRTTANSLGLQDDDWVWVTSHANRIRAQLKLMDGVNANTVWTWNAIGKRAGAWNLATDSPEFSRGFLLNHLIAETLPANDAAPEGNADPITGQAAWYDLRVRVEKAPAAEAGESAPHFAVLGHPASLSAAPDLLLYGLPRQ
jgi:anaerobic selenocysteine-containing dehydrogenase